MTVDDALMELIGIEADDWGRTRDILTRLFRGGYDEGYAERDREAKARRKAAKNSRGASRERRKAAERHLNELQARYDQGVADGWAAARQIASERF